MRRAQAPWPCPHRRCARVRLEPERTARGDQRPRQKIGGDHRKCHGHRHRLEQKLPQAGREYQGGEHQERAKRRDQLGHRHLAGPQKSGFVRGRPEPQVPVGVFQADDGAIDHRTDRQGHAGQGHHVDRLAREIKARRARHDRNRQRHDRDGRHPHFTQEQQDDQRAEDRAQAPLPEPEPRSISAHIPTDP